MVATRLIDNPFFNSRVHSKNVTTKERIFHMKVYMEK